MRTRTMWILALALAGVMPMRGQVPESAEDAFTDRVLRSHDVPALQAGDRAVRSFLSRNPGVRTSAPLRKVAWGFAVGSQKAWYADDLTQNGVRYQVASTCRAVGSHCYVFVEDLSWNAGRVTQAQVDSVQAAFDLRTPASTAKGIYQQDVDAFGFPPDVDADPRIVILLLDIKDGYTPGSGFVVGYFYALNEIPPSTPGYSTSNGAEIFYLDCNPLDLSTSFGLREGMSTLAHEFQHMIHFNYDYNEITFVDESCALVAEVIAGYPLYSPNRYVNETNHYLFDWRTGDLNLVLNDYSRAARFSLYFRDQFGTGVFRPIVASQLTGIDGINQGLTNSGLTSRRFGGIFQDWTIANILDDVTVNSAYGYLYPGLPKAVGRSYPSPVVPATLDTVEALGARYLSFTGGSALSVTISSGSPALVFKAVETGPSAKRVVNIISATPFNEPAFGTTYTNVHIVATNTSTTTRYVVSYQASGIPTAAARDPEAQPDRFELQQNYPNPFNGQTVITYSLPRGREQEYALVRLEVNDLLGRNVATLVDGPQAAGTHTVRWDAGGLPSGTYFYTLRAAGAVATQRLLLLR